MPARPRSTPRTLFAAALVAAALFAGGCGGQVGTTPRPGAAEPTEGPNVAVDPPVTSIGPADLIGNWRVEGAPEEDGAVLRIAPEADLSLWLRCGQLTGSWSANAAQLLVLSFSGGSGECDVQKAYNSSWLYSVTGYRRGEAGPELTDASGGVVARLLPGGRPTPGPNILPSEAEEPGLTEQSRPHWQQLPDLPPSVQPVPRETLLGKWGIAGADKVGRPQVPHATFEAGGRWSGSDGCNRTSGRWTLGDGGALVTTTGPQTLAGCANVMVLPEHIARAAVDGEELVLYGFDGEPVQRLTRLH